MHIPLIAIVLFMFLREVITLTIRPMDDTGDILPVLTASDLLSGAPAVTALVRDRLNLLSGEWWENPAWGCEIFEMLWSGRVTEQDVPALTSYLVSYIQSTSGVVSVEDVATAVSGRRFSFSYRVVTEDGGGDISYSLNF